MRVLPYYMKLATVAADNDPTGWVLDNGVYVLVFILIIEGIQSGEVPHLGTNLGVSVSTLILPPLEAVLA